MPFTPIESFECYNSCTMYNVHVHVHSTSYHWICTCTCIMTVLILIAIINTYVHTVGRLFFKGYKYLEFRDFLKIRKNYFRKNQILTVQDGRRHKFAKIKSAKLILRQIREIYSPRKKGALRYVYVTIIDRRSTHVLHFLMHLMLCVTDANQNYFFQ